MLRNYPCNLMPCRLNEYTCRRNKNGRKQNARNHNISIKYYLECFYFTI